MKPADIAITNIRENEDGTVSFDYNVQSSVADIMIEGEGELTYYNLQGVRQEAGNLVRAYIWCATAMARQPRHS